MSWEGNSPGRRRGAADLTARLTELHAAYVEQVNQAVAEGRDDLIQALARAYPDDALAEITGVERVA